VAFVNENDSFVCLSFFHLEREETMGKSRVLWVDEVLGKVTIKEHRYQIVKCVHSDEDLKKRTLRLTVTCFPSFLSSSTRTDRQFKKLWRRHLSLFKFFNQK
jgi:hypothetical protein